MGRRKGKDSQEAKEPPPLKRTEIRKTISKGGEGPSRTRKSHLIKISVHTLMHYIV